MAEHKIVAKNRRAAFDYEIDEKIEAGIMLTGSEIKSVREGSVNLRGSFVTFHGDVPMLTNAHIAQYKPAAALQHDPTRSRQLLLKKSEVRRLIGLLQTQGVTALPLEIYLKGRWAKILIGIGRGKKKYDKRQSIKEREANVRMRQVQRRRG